MSRWTHYRRVAGACVIAAVVATGSSVAQQPARSTEIDADSLSFDFETRTTVAANFRFTNGNVSISAAEGRRVASDDATEDWALTGDVVVAVDSAIARADRASARFSSGRLVSSELVGEPVSIEQPGEDPFRGSASRIAYDDVKGVFSATGNATFTYGAQEWRCDWIYDVRQRTARGFASGDESCTYLRRQSAP